jgi:hypothetical protein
MTVSSATQKVQYNGNGSTTVFAYTFKIFDQNDLTVIVRSATGTETVKTITTHYTVSGVGSAGGGNVTMLTAPASGETLTILREQDLVQELDLVENDPFPAQSLEDALDKLTFVVQQQGEELDRSIKASRTNTITSTEFTVSAANRASKVFAFDSAGELSVTQELGTYRGNWATATAFAQRDLVKDTSNNSIYIVVTAHTSTGSQPISSNVDVAKWALIVDAAAATGGPFADGTAALPSITNTDDLNTGLYFPAADTVAVATAGDERMRIGSTGNVGIGTSSPTYPLTVQSGSTGLTGFNRDIVSRKGDQTNFYRTSIVSNDSASASGAFGAFASGIYHEHGGGFGASGGLTFATNTANAGPITFATVNTERMRIDASGNVGIGTVLPVSELEVVGAADIITASSVTTAGIVATTTTANIAYCALINSARSWNIRNNTSGSFVIRDQTAASDRVTIDTSGNVGIGTSSPQAKLDIGDTSAAFTASIIRASTTGIAELRFADTADNAGFVSYDHTSNYMRFATSATERMRIDLDGNVTVGTTSSPTTLVSTTTISGAALAAAGHGVFVRDSNEPVTVNRLTNDGTLLSLRQAGVAEGTISVSGTTVSYNGGHLSRWAQLPDNSRPELLKGTVMSNLDQMSNWDNEENEQLNCVQISTVEGDANVAGLFVAWDSTEDDYNDILLAMTGDMVIRIAAGVTVARGDLLMSAGDGTAKPQADDIIRAKTIAKVTSNHVSHTYADGSYAVPCVVMAC